MKTEEIRELDIKTLLSNGDEYIIPIYQRNYAWEAKEIEQLLQDIIDYSKNHKDKNYYIGTLVVANNIQDGSHYYNTIDGQQRLTTLTILSSVIKNNFSSEVDLSWFNHLNLSFASRQKSMLSIDEVFAGKFEIKNFEINIRNGYNICLKELEKKLAENATTLNDFATYLYKYVKILRVPLPDGIDLNHYFEIMNSRGEQLEKHEILKAKLMGYFNDLPDREKYEAAFDLIWEACSNMEKYLQYGFSVEQRHIVFGQNDWNSLCVYDFDDLINKLDPLLSSNTSTESSIDDIINSYLHEEKELEKEETPDRFNSVINFQNFLLHVLRVQLKKDEVALDDKRLIEIFDNQMKTLSNNEKILFVKEYIYNLLKSKFLFDKYIIKREFTANTDRWSLKCLKWYSSGKTKNGVKYLNTFGEETSESFDNDNRRILMLLSMFHVSIPSMSYKYWLNASLNYLMGQIDIDSKDYICYLEHIAKSFVYDRFLTNKPSDYFEMIHSNKGPINRDINQLNWEKLLYGTIENNLVFNYCDYLLWLKMKDTVKDIRVKAYEYTFRSSVEHHYPQNPINADVVRIDEKYLHQFGNLCLISHEKNSRLNNLSPSGKKDYYPRGVPLDSLKQYIMMEQNPWGIKQIVEHNKEMIQLFLDNINSNYCPKSNVSLAVKWFNEYKVRDKILLIRTLLCFGHCAKNINGIKYNFFDFEYIRNHNSFKQFEEYVIEKSPKNLNEIINRHLDYTRIINSWRYLFIKYPQVIEYCQEGNMLWYEEFNGQLIYLLKTDRATKNKSVEIYTYILSLSLKERLGFDFYIDFEGLYLNIKMENNRYKLIESSNDAEIQIKIWNDGKTINYQLNTYINGNAKTIKNLSDFSWKKQEDGTYERLGTSKLIKLGLNFEENIFNLTAVLNKLLKNGLGIKLQ